MIDPITLLRAAEAGLPAAESHPDPALVCFPMRIDWENTLDVDPATESFPAPITTSRQIVARVTWPSPVLKLAEFAREASWDVHTQCSQGYMPHAITGRPGALKDLIGMQFCRHPMTDRSAYAIYSRNAGQGTWTWTSFMVWGPDLPPAKLYDLAALKAYLEMAPESSAMALRSWTRDLAEIEENRKALARRTAKSRQAKPKEDHA